MFRRPIMVAVGGDSGTGKTTLCRGLDTIFGAERIETICLDDYHALDRRQRSAVGLTALDPRANNFAAMEEDLWTLREGRAIDKPVYDHSNGTIVGPERVEPKDIIVVQGLFPLYTRSLRGLFDVAVWLDPETELKMAWKIQRDVTQRGYSEEQVRAEIIKRESDVRAHIAPQGKHADLTVRFSRPATWSTAPDDARLATSIRKGGRFRPLDSRARRRIYGCSRRRVNSGIRRRSSRSTGRSPTTSPRPCRIKFGRTWIRMRICVRPAWANSPERKEFT